ncbi:MAG: aldo/keto reductase, partial [Ignavibacteria bacterium]|nr:aldo/keto reductase [Ignavibacteria bacterium]
HKVSVIKKLNELAKTRNQSLAQMAIAWLLKDERITSILIGASSVSQLENNVASLNNLGFTSSELGSIEKILSEF